MTGILPYDIGTEFCSTRMAHIVPGSKPGDLGADDELGKLIAEKAAATAASARADERSRRENLISEKIDHVLQHELAKLCQLPDVETRDRYKNQMTEFIRWASTRGLGHLPARSSTVAAFLVDGILQAEFSAAEAKERAAAIQWCHSSTEQWLDPIPIAAALLFVQKVDDDANIIAEAVADLVSKPTNGNGAAHE